MSNKTVLAILSACPLILASATDRRPGVYPQQSAAPVITVAKFRQLCTDKTLTNPVTLEGTVTLPQGGLPDNPFVFYLQDATGGISVSPPRDIGLRVSDRARAIARCSLFDEHLVVLKQPC